MPPVIFQILQATCNHQCNPLGIDTAPIFSWKMSSALPGDTQTAYRICVTQNAALVWDSGVISSSQSLSIPYAGHALLPRTRYHWQVTAWNSQGEAAQSHLCFFETAKLSEPWCARWIGAPGMRLDSTDAAAPYLRKTFSLTGPVHQARLYICGLGLYEAWLEGKRISDFLLEPAYTKYDAHALYRVHDITDLLPAGGDATLGVILGNGWYNCFTKDAWNAPQSTWRGVPRLLCELHIQYEDGTYACICSDDTWRTSQGPIVFNAIRSGEHYDARLEQPGWCTHSFNDAHWVQAIRLRSPGGHLQAAQGAPIRATQVLQPVRNYCTAEGRRIFDFGQNLAGKAELLACGPAGSTFVLRYAEELTPDGAHVDQSHLRCFIREGEFQTDHYIKKSDAPERWSCRFVYHGFRYVELETTDGQLDACQLSAVVMHTDFGTTGGFSCSDEGLNTIQQMSLWSTRSNAMGLPASDPHREKNAWTGDNNFASEQLLLNFDSLHLLTLWMDTVCACQRADGAIPCVCPSTGWGFNWGNGPDWSMVLTALPWRLYNRTLDVQLLERYYPYIVKHFSFMRSMAVDNIVDYGIGDWCAPFDGPAISVNMESFKAPTALTDTACYYEAACILDEMSQVLGKPNPYAAYKEEIGKAILKHFVRDPLTVAGDCQTSDACIVWHQLLPAQQQAALAQQLEQRIAQNNYHLDFGVLGQRYVMETLGNYGYTRTLYNMLRQDTYPSYLYLAKNGCTTLTECWNLGGSHNHVMFSHVSAILYRYIAGLSQASLSSAQPHFSISPSLLTQTMDCWHETPWGRLSIQWKITDDGANLTIEIPFGCTADLILPPFAEVDTQTLLGGTHPLHLRLRPDAPRFS